MCFLGQLWKSSMIEHACWRPVRTIRGQLRAPKTISEYPQMSHEHFKIYQGAVHLGVIGKFCRVVFGLVWKYLCLALPGLVAQTSTQDIQASGTDQAPSVVVFAYYMRPSANVMYLYHRLIQMTLPGGEKRRKDSAAHDTSSSGV